MHQLSFRPDRSENRRKATTFPGSTRLGQARGPKDENLHTLSLHPTNGRDVYQTPRRGRNPPPGHSNGVRYSNSTGSSSHRHDRSFKLVRYHYDALSGPGHLSELRVILQLFHGRRLTRIVSLCVSISRLAGRFGHARPHGRLRPSKGGAVLIRFLIAPDVSGIDW